MVQITESKIISGVYTIQDDRFTDSRGSIWTSYLRSNFKKIVPIEFNHDKFTTSKKNVLRGIHYDNKSWKIISCVHGKAFQVCVDLRKKSPTYMSWQSWTLDAKHNTQILMSPMIGNAWVALSSTALYHYKWGYKGKYPDVDQQGTIAWNDAKIGVKWPIKKPILSKRDKQIHGSTDRL